MSSGRFVLRMPPEQHAILKKAALQLDCSLNDLCVSRLSVASPMECLPPDMTAAIKQLCSIGGENLVGVVVFGSWARNELTDASDIDVLVVLNRNAKLTRRLYREWEKAQLSPSIEPHFVKLPTTSDPVSGLWAEVALDGLIICDSGFALQQYLGHVRHCIASGRLVARRVHGQNYWVHTGLHDYAQ